MKKILALLGVFSLAACVAPSSEERAFENRRYMLEDDDNADAGSDTVMGYFGQNRNSDSEYEYDENYSAPQDRQSGAVLEVEQVPAQRVASGDLPRYQVVERVENAEPMPPIPLETVAMQPEDNQPISVQGVNVPPKQTRHVRFEEIQEKPRNYKKYKDVYVLDTPRGIVNLWEETVSPEVYEIVAARIANRMLAETEDIYGGVLKPSIYVAEIESADGDFDNGFYLSRKIIQDILIGTQDYRVVGSQESADYYLDLEVYKHDVEYGMDKILEFKMTMFDKNNKKVQEFSELIKQVKNDDRSWW